MVKTDGTMGSHNRIAADGYSRLGRCSGVDHPPVQLVGDHDAQRP
jgi:hypothetical protein